MLGLKLLIAAGAAAVIVWRCFYRREEENEPDKPGECEECDLSLEVVSGPAVKSQVRASFKGQPLTIGRLPYNTLTVSDPLVSGEHAIVSWNPKRCCWVLRDVGSMNGTKLNNDTISQPNRRSGEEHSLKNGDVIKLAEDVQLIVELHHPLPYTEETATGGEILSHLKVAPRSGNLNAPAPQVPVAGHQPTGPYLERSMFGQLPKAQHVEYYFPALQAEFAFITQVGMHHWKEEKGSEDVAFWESPFSDFFKAGLFGVCDGHFGSDASKEVQRRLPKVLAEGMAPLGRLLASAENGSVFRRSFLEVDEKLESDGGCTATVILAERYKDGSLALRVGNVGDSMAILVDPEKGKYQPLTADHRVASQPEKERLKAKGTHLSHGETRMYMLNLARAMGDRSFKEMDIGLIAEPFISDVISLPASQGGLVVMASDGLWDGLEHHEVAKLAIRSVQAGHPLRDLASHMLKAAIDRGVTDDITISIIRFLPIPDMSMKEALQTRLVDTAPA